MLVCKLRIFFFHVCVFMESVERYVRASLAALVVVGVTAGEVGAAGDGATTEPGLRPTTERAGDAPEPNTIIGLDNAAGAARQARTEAGAIQSADEKPRYSAIKLIPGGSDPSQYYIGIRMRGEGGGLTIVNDRTIAPGPYRPKDDGSLIHTPYAIGPGGDTDGSIDASFLGWVAQYRAYRLFQKTGASTWRLDGETDTSLPWQLLQGTLSIEGNEALGTGPLAFDGGTLQVRGTRLAQLSNDLSWGAKGGGFDIAEAENTFTLSQRLTGAGMLWKGGAGALVLAAENSFTGGLMAEAGTVVAGAKGAFGIGPLSIAAGATVDLAGFDQSVTGLAGAGRIVLGTARLTSDQTGDTTFSGVISGAGSLTKSGPGTLTLNGLNSYTGPTTVTGGTLIVGDDGHPGAVLSSRVTVDTGGTLGGIGRVDGLDVGAGGTVAPGASIGALSVARHARFASGAVFQVNVDATGASDRLDISGRAEIAGGTVDVRAAPGTYAPTTVYRILTAAGGVSGTFSGATSNFAFLAPQLGYGANEVTLTLARNDVGFADVAQTRNERAVADDVEMLGPGNTVYDAVIELSAPSAPAAFEALSGEVHASTRGVMLDGGRFVGEAIAERLRQGGTSTSGLLAPLGPAGQVQAYAPGGARDLQDQKAATPVLPPPYSLWGEGFGAWGRRGSDGNAAGIETSTGGFVLGADVPLGEIFRIGVAGGYARTSLRGDGTSGKLDAYYGAVYGGAQWGALGLRLGAAYGWHDLALTRTVVFPGFAETLKGRQDAQTVQVFGELGYRLTFGGLTLEPFAGLSHVELMTEAFTETGGAAALRDLGRDAAVTFTTLGLRADHRWALTDMTALALRGTIGWRHAFGDTKPTSALAFAAGGPPFTVAGVPIAENALILKAGLDLDIDPDMTLGLTYSAQLARKARDQQIKGLFTLRF
jgi:outer membrane autotransporter protein